jgi:hypothetical protein
MTKVEEKELTLENIAKVVRSLEERELVHLYAEEESPKFERAAMRWLERFSAEEIAELALGLFGAGDVEEVRRGARAYSIRHDG